MDHDEKLFEAWESGVALGDAWWDFAENESKKLFRERQVEGRSFHLEIQYTLEIDLIARLQEGKLQAYGIEKGSDVGPTPIARYYFSKTANWIMSTIPSLHSARNSMRSEFKGSENRQMKRARASER